MYLPLYPSGPVITDIRTLHHIRSERSACFAEACELSCESARIYDLSPKCAIRSPSPA